MRSSPSRQPAEVLAIESAIEQVLRAEQAAREGTLADAAQAQEFLEVAQAHARAIAERGARCTVRVHQWADTCIARQRTRIAAERDRLRETGSPDGGADAAGQQGFEEERLRAVVEQLAAQLTADLPGDAPCSRA